MMLRISITHLNAQPSVCGMKNLLFLDNNLFEPWADILDNETSDVAAAKDIMVEMRTLILQPTIIAIFTFSRFDTNITFRIHSKPNLFSSPLCS